MIVRTYYSTGRLDVFDTTNLTDSSSVPGNLMTNWSIRVKGINEEQSLWMSMLWYEAVALEDTADYAGLPIARIREGWSFVLVDIDEMPWLERVDIDGKTAFVRQGERLMECVSLDAAAERAFTINAKAIENYKYYLATDAGGDPRRAHEKACALIGCDADMYAFISLAHRKAMTAIKEGGYREDDTESLL